MKQLNETLKTQIKEAIESAERQSSCEFVAVITQKSGNYRIYAFFVVALSALLIPHLIFWLTDWFRIEKIFQWQITSFILLMILTQLSVVTNALAPSAVKHRQAALVAQQSFRKFGLYRTSKRRAILFFVSIDEKYAEIITDIGIDEKVPKETWQAVIEVFRQNLETKNVAQGYLEAIETCGAILKREFPAEAGDVDELPNELIIDQN
ncbi:TPM domain-containing protein [Sulfuricurvum sp.]|uniref:TPM domain-containing protein n=1 Tax=Sulfuricurvum sp. TaxID=2025608 RepID=UPI002D6633A4|nr:TPM domain-containing protein [Sulfuricurvum sp.]HZF70968.1 TPM domain-containing protein [Sulfuricurvum sp.]